MAARSRLTAGQISKLLSETINFESSEVLEAVTDYFGVTNEATDNDESSSEEEEAPEPPVVEDNTEKAELEHADNTTSHTCRSFTVCKMYPK